MATSNKMTHNIHRTDSENPDFKILVAELDKYLGGINGDADDFFAQYNKIDMIRHVVMVYDSDMPVGCGALKIYEPGIMEIKRMYVIPTERGKGIAGKILEELLHWARESGYEKCILETSRQMTDAVQLYSKHHFKVIPNYGQYIGIDSSICFEKKI